jgi:hypothetical protein
MSMPHYTQDPGGARPRPVVDAGRLWMGGVATALELIEVRRLPQSP